ncbi:uncharacterized protein PG998_006598 [Apiospora kogelbergensis]|uniref:uncharacterized protein n=1 Tax=Apiospora kogelbergensis TaxID=1337665 RepID=UPI00312E071B
MSSINLAVAIPTLVGSILSLLATSIALVAHVVAPPGRHFRHALILNLLIADGINSLNNSISGIFTMINLNKPEPLSPGPACNANAFVGQLSVQAVDFNILIMSITVLFTLRTRRLSAEPSRLTIISLCALAWVPSIITSSIGMGLDAYGPVSGNWCWISSERASLRYALTHSWRMAIFLATFVIYTYIYIHLKRTFNRFALSTTPTTNHNIPGDHQHQVGGKANDSLDTTDTSEIIVKKTFYIDTGDHSPAAATTNPVSFASATHGEASMPLQDLESARTSNGAALARPLKADANDRHVHGGRPPRVQEQPPQDALVERLPRPVHRALDTGHRDAADRGGARVLAHLAVGDAVVDAVHRPRQRGDV